MATTGFEPMTSCGSRGDSNQWANRRSVLGIRGVKIIYEALPFFSIKKRRNYKTRWGRAPLPLLPSGSANVTTSHNYTTTPYDNLRNYHPQIAKLIENHPAPLHEPVENHLAPPDHHREHQLQQWHTS